MATAQILIVVKSPSDIPREVFQSAVEAAARTAGVATSSWTYDATPVLLERETDSAYVQVVKGGPWNGLEFTSGAPLAPGQSSAVLSAYRQNVVGLPEGREGSVAASIAERLQTTFRSYGEVRSGVKTIRNSISWDRGIPAAIAISGSGGAARGVVTAAGIFGLLTLGAIYYGGRR